MHTSERDTLADVTIPVVQVPPHPVRIERTPARTEALKARRIFGAALDVLEKEPIAADCPLIGLDNVILTDHTGWYSEASVRSIQEKAGLAAAEMLTTGIQTNWVNKW